MGGKRFGKKQGQGGGQGGGQDGGGQWGGFQQGQPSYGGGQGGGNQGNQPYVAPFNPYKPIQAPISGSQRSNLRQQIIFSAGDPQSAHGRNSDTPCTMHVSIRDPTLNPDHVVSEFTRQSDEIPHMDRVSRLHSPTNQLVFGMSARDALTTLRTRHADVYSDSPIHVSLHRFAGPSGAPTILNPMQMSYLLPYVEGQGVYVMDLSMLPLKESVNLPWSFENESYFGAVISSLLNPIFIPVTFLRLSHVALHKIDALAPLANILEGLDLSYNQIPTVQKECSILSDFTRLQEVNLLGNPCTDDAEYRNKLNSMNRMITTIDGVSLAKLAVFFSVAPSTVVEMAMEVTPDDPILSFIIQFLEHFDNDRIPASAQQQTATTTAQPGTLSSAYTHDAAFSLHYMSRGVSNPDFAPIAMRRNVGILLSSLPPSAHDLDTLVIEDCIPVFGGILRMVQFRVDCYWSAAYRTKYKRTFLLQEKAQKPWDLTILNDQIQLECDWNEYAFIFSNVLSSSGAAGPIPTQLGGGSRRAVATANSRTWNLSQSQQIGGFQNQQQRQNKRGQVNQQGQQQQQQNQNGRNQQNQQNQGGQRGNQRNQGNQGNQGNQANFQGQGGNRGNSQNQGGNQGGRAGSQNQRGGGQQSGNQGGVGRNQGGNQNQGQNQQRGGFAGGNRGNRRGGQGGYQ